jgi:glycine cleavage system H protein
MTTSNVPADLRYTKDHEWARKESDGNVRVGITAFAVDQLGDITLVELPKVGTVLESGKAFGTVESVKTLSDLYAPIAGTVVAINDDLATQPELVNNGVYEKGWMIVLKPASAGDVDSLLDASAYKTHLDGLDH